MSPLAVVAVVCVLAISQVAGDSSLVLSSDCDISDALAAVTEAVEATGVYCDAIYAGFWTYNEMYADCIDDDASDYGTLASCLFNVTQEWYEDFAPATQVFVPEFVGYVQRFVQDIASCSL